MNVQWYPGHMTKAKRQMQEDIKLIDLIIELVDARVPLSSRNPDIDELGKNKARMILLNKADLADERQNRAWMEYFKEKGIYAVSIDSRNKGSMKAVSAAITEACKDIQRFQLFFYIVSLSDRCRIKQGAYDPSQQSRSCR